MAGRPKGKKSAKTIANEANVARIARSYADNALSVLNQIATAGESEAARVSAANSILDRAYGKPAQMIEGNPDKPVGFVVTWQE